MSGVCDVSGVCGVRVCEGRVCDECGFVRVVCSGDQNDVLHFIHHINNFQQHYLSTQQHINTDMNTSSSSSTSHPKHNHDIFAWSGLPETSAQTDTKTLDPKTKTICAMDSEQISHSQRTSLKHHESAPEWRDDDDSTTWLNNMTTRQRPRHVDTMTRTRRYDISKNKHNPLSWSSHRHNTHPHPQTETHRHPHPTIVSRSSSQRSVPKAHARRARVHTWATSIVKCDAPEAELTFHYTHVGALLSSLLSSLMWEDCISPWSNTPHSAWVQWFKPSALSTLKMECRAKNK